MMYQESLQNQSGKTNAISYHTPKNVNGVVK